jgi:serine protease Do
MSYILKWAVLLLILPCAASAASLVDVIKQVKPSVVAIIMVQKDPRAPAQLVGTGFAVADGKHIITNHHVIRDRGEAGGGQVLFALTQNGPITERRALNIKAIAPSVDLALLKLDGLALPPMRIRGEADLAPEGTDIAMTGFPLGAVIGFHPSTSRGIISALTPNRSPEYSSFSLDPAAIRAIRYQTYQLDLVAYPGNSGGPLYDASSGDLIGVVNSTFIKSTKEKVLSEPSGISYAIPSGFVRQILMENGLTP